MAIYGWLLKEFQDWLEQAELFLFRLQRTRYNSCFSLAFLQLYLSMNATRRPTRHMMTDVRVPWTSLLHTVSQNCLQVNCKTSHPNQGDESCFSLVCAALYYDGARSRGNATDKRHGDFDIFPAPRVVLLMGFDRTVFATAVPIKRVLCLFEDDNVNLL